MEFKSKKIGSLLSIGFGIVILFLVVGGGVGYMGSHYMGKLYKDALTGDAAVSLNAAYASSNIKAMRQFEKNIFLRIASKSDYEDDFSKWTDQYKLAVARMSELERIVRLQSDRDAVKRVKTELANYEAGFKKTYQGIQEGRIATPQDGDFSVNEYRDSIRNIERTIYDLEESGKKQMSELENAVGSSSKLILIALVVLTLVGIILAVLISMGISRMITRPLKKAVTGLTASSDQVASASVQIAQSSRSLADGASQQASGLEETSSAMTEMSAMTKQSADNARVANSMVAEASQYVEQANKSMLDLNGAMSGILSASNETSKIIKTIDEIAFQTNLLALNAAVEAARAGEVGAGFAVVADEVRNLAMRAAEAAKQTEVLIEDTLVKISGGSSIVTRTNADFTEVAVKVNKIRELIAEMAAAAREQAEGIDQVSQTVSMLDKVVQKNAENAEDSAYLAKSMEEQAQFMKGHAGDLSAMVDGVGESGNKPETRLLAEKTV